MTIEEAREWVNGPLWPALRDRLLETGRVEFYPKGDLRRLEYLPAAKRAELDEWRRAIDEVEGWSKVVDGAHVREIQAAFPHAYPAALRYKLYFKKDMTDEEKARLLLKIKFPEVMALCCS